MADYSGADALRPVYLSRRHRFMESSDFTVAAERAFEVLASAVAENGELEAVFVGFQLDPVTPGRLLGAAQSRAKSTGQRHVKSRLMDMLADQGKNFSLVGFAMPMDDTVPDAAGTEWPRRGVALTIASIDRAVHTFFNAERNARTVALRYAPLRFVTA